jgi:hypothetical protein
VSAPPPRGPQALSTQTQLLIMAAVLVVPIIVVAVFLATELYRAQKATFEQTAREAAWNSTTTIEREIVGMTRTLQVLSTSEALRRGDLPAFHRQATEAASVENIVVVVRDAESRQLLNTGIALGDPLPTTSRLTDIDRQAIQTSRPVVCGFYVAVSNSQPTFAVVTPFVDSEGRQRLLSVSSHVSRLRNILREENSGTWRAAILDAAGVIITRIRDPDMSGQRASDNFWGRASSSESGIWSGLATDGTWSLTGFQRTSFGWTVVVGAPTAALDASLRNLVTYLGAGLITLVVTAFGTAIMMARRISRPVVALEDLSTRLSRGERVVPKLTSNREANAVGQMLEASSDILRQREQALTQSQSRYRSLFEAIDEGFCIVRMIRNAAGEPTDYVFAETIRASRNTPV